VILATKRRKGRQRRSRPNATATAPPALPSNDLFSSKHDTLRKLYSSLLRCRLIQERIRELSASNPSGAKYELAIGREAVAVGATADLGPEDTVATSPRNLAALVARGAAVQALLGAAEHDLSGLVLSGDPFNFGTGIALARKLEQKGHVVVAFCAHEKPPLEAWHNALKFAAVHKLPIVFVIENGIAAESPSEEPAPHLESLSFLARDYGFPGILVDGNDAVAVARVTQESIHRARNGSGPTLIDCRTDSARDPLAHMEHYMRKRHAWDEAWRQQAEREITVELDAAQAQRRPQQ